MEKPNFEVKDKFGIIDYLESIKLVFIHLFKVSAINYTSSEEGFKFYDWMEELQKDYQKFHPGLINEKKFYEWLLNKFQLQ
jgi:hypothetical protein